MAEYNFYGFYTASKQGKTGLTVTCSVYRASTGAKVADAQSATEIAGGLYRYSYDTATEDDYLAVFATADATVDAQHLPALVPVQQPRLDATVSTRLPTSGYTSPDNASIAAIKAKTDNLPASPAAAGDIPAAPAVADAVWDEAMSEHQTTGSAGKALTDAGASGNPWEAPVRTLTQSAAQIVSIVTGGNLALLRGDLWMLPVTGLGSLVDFETLDFTVKRGTAYSDSAATLRVRLSNPGAPEDGLVRLNGTETTAPWASIVVNDLSAGNITITILADASKDIAPGEYVYDIQMIGTNGVHTLTSGKLIVVGDVTHAIQ